MLTVLVFCSIILYMEFIIFYFARSLFSISLRAVVCTLCKASLFHILILQLILLCAVKHVSIRMLKTGHLLIADIFVWNSRSPQKTLTSSQNSAQLLIRSTKSWSLRAISIEHYPTIAGTLERYGNYIKCN